MGILDNAKLIELGKQAQDNHIAKTAINKVAPTIAEKAFYTGAKDAISKYGPAIQNHTANAVLNKLGIHPGYNSLVGLSQHLIQGIA